MQKTFEIIWPKIVQNHQLPESTLQSTSGVIPQTWSKLRKENVLPHKEEFGTVLFILPEFLSDNLDLFQYSCFLKRNHGRCFIMRVVKHWHSCPVPGDIQGEGLWATSSVEDVPDLWRGWTIGLLMAPSNPNYSVIYDFPYLNFCF